MRLCYTLGGDGPFVGLASGERWFNLSLVLKANPDRFPWLSTVPEPRIEEILANVPNLLDTMAELLDHLDSSGLSDTYRIDEPQELLSPITRPSKIIGLGRNYLGHAQETGLSVPDEPLIFAMAPSSIIGPGADIVYPPMVTRLDPETELGFVIGRRAKDIPEDRAMEYVAGYTIVNDVTARDMQMRDVEEGKAWFRTKSFDTFTPMGPHLVLVDEVKDPHDLQITLRVNGEVRQDSTTALCIFKIPQIIHNITTFMTLEPGDVIATGTPEGIAPLQRGDVLECTITGLGTLVNQVV
jgi:2-keto-4-pentenoate hydratase/2-oxohepta-3-ene-1,7-dioic acid hydratase in catechol pathway